MDDFIELYRTQQTIKKKKSDRPGVNGSLPRIGIPDHEFEFVIIQGLRPVSASAAVKLIHRLNIEDRLSRLCAATGGARRTAPNHIHVVFPRCLCRRQLETTKLSVPLSPLHSPTIPYSSLFYILVLCSVSCVFFFFRLGTSSRLFF